MRLTRAQAKAAGIDPKLLATKRAKVGAKAKVPVVLRGEHQMQIWLELP